jgi:hypothetical protein
MVDQHIGMSPKYVETDNCRTEDVTQCILDGAGIDTAKSITQPPSSDQELLDLCWISESEGHLYCNKHVVGEELIEGRGFREGAFFWP